ncbi:MAG: hypothetical protein ACKV2V_26985 [Blastocatellia bacterium]
MMLSPPDTCAFDIPPEIVTRLRTGELLPAQLLGLSRQRLYQIAYLGHQLAQSSRLDEARVIFAGLAAADPRDSVFHCHLAAVCQRLGDADTALAEYDAALTANPRNVEALAGRGEIRLERDEIRAGMEDLRLAIRLDPAAKRAVTVRARALLQVYAREVER